MNNIYTPYIIPVYAGGYVASSVSPIMYRKPIGSKTVTIKGVTDNSMGMSLVSDDVVFVLPVGYRPVAERIFISNNSADIFFIRIKTNGEVSLAGDITTVSTIGCWMNISFDID